MCWDETHPASNYLLSPGVELVLKYKGRSSMNMAITQQQAPLSPPYTYGRYMCTPTAHICRGRGTAHPTLPPSSELAFDIYVRI